MDVLGMINSEITVNNGIFAYKVFHIIKIEIFLVKYIIVVEPVVVPDFIVLLEAHPIMFPIDVLFISPSDINHSILMEIDSFQLYFLFRKYSLFLV